MVILISEILLKNEVFTEIVFRLTVILLIPQILVLLFHRKNGSFHCYLELRRVYVLGALYIYS